MLERHKKIKISLVPVDIKARNADLLIRNARVLTCFLQPEGPEWQRQDHKYHGFDKTKVQKADDSINDYTLF